MMKYGRMMAALLIALCCLCVGYGACAEEQFIYPGCAHHDHDASCGGLVNLCTYICQRCVREIQQMVDDLPALNQPITDENREDYIAQMIAIDQRKYLISDDAREQIDFVFYELTALRLSPPNPAAAKNTAYLAISVTCTGDVPRETPAPTVSLAASTSTSTKIEPDGRYTIGNFPVGEYRLSENGYQTGGYLCETKLYVNGEEVKKTPGYSARWNLTLEGEMGYVIDFVNRYTQVPGAIIGSGSEGNDADGMPQTGDDSKLVLYLAIAVGCAMGAWLARNKKRNVRIK